MKDPRQQRDFAVVVKVNHGEHEELRALLESLDDLVGKDDSAFAQLGTTHFMRWVILPPLEPQDAWQLALSTNYDPPRERHLRELIAAFDDTLHEIYSHCHDYPVDPSVDQVLSYFDAHQVRSQAFYVGHSCRTRGQIRDEAELRKDLQAACDEIDLEGESWAGKSQKQVRDHLRAVAEARRDAAKVGFLAKKVDAARIRLVLSVGFWGLLALLSLPFLLVPLLIRERLEARANRANAERSFKQAYKPEHRDALLDREDLVVQNQITHLVRIKKGWSRWVSLRITLRLINGLARYYFNKGKLYGIPTIHFARWCIIDKGRRLLFFSNYDGSWESYLGDFVDQAAKGLTGVWNNTEGFPKAKFLVWQGALDEEHFKDWTRAHQLRTQVWYSSYRNLSVRNVNHNAALRRGLVARPAGEEQEDSWTELL